MKTTNLTKIVLSLMMSASLAACGGNANTAVTVAPEA